MTTESTATTEADTTTPAADTATTASTATSAITDWTQTVPEKFRTADGVNYEAIFKSYTELEQKMGSQPQVPDDYTMDFGDLKLSEEDAKEFDAFKASMREAGVTQPQFEAMMGQMLPTLEAAREDIRKELAEQYAGVMTPDQGRDALKAAWGEKYGQTMGAVQRIATAYNKSQADLNSFGFNDPNVLKLLADLSGNFKEAKPVDGQKVTDSLAQIRANPAYWDTRHPEYAGLHRRAMELTSLKVG